MGNEAGTRYSDRLNILSRRSQQRRIVFVEAEPLVARLTKPASESAGCVIMVKVERATTALRFADYATLARWRL